jgi:SAM-dependent methyltransferase
MALTPADWHDRFTRQARWTHDLRRYLYERAGMRSARRILDVGCGTGVLAAEMPRYTQASIHGLDINPAHLSLASAHAPQTVLACGDAHHLPYARASFDLSLCHFLLLWVADPTGVVREMARVTRPGGAVLALAEPDYGGRIDYPEALEPLGSWQQASLRSQGADPLIGRKLAGIFAGAGLQAVETGVLGGQWSGPPSNTDWESEWAVITDDLNQMSAVAFEPAADVDLQKLKELDASAWSRGERVLYLPTFYAWARLPD